MEINKTPERLTLYSGTYKNWRREFEMQVARINYLIDRIYISMKFTREPPRNYSGYANNISDFMHCYQSRADELDPDEIIRGQKKEVIPQLERDLKMIRSRNY